MKYQTVIFDFDSTLIRFESLEVILAKVIEADKAKQQKFVKLTEMAMNGDLSFQQALQKRLEIALPSKQGIADFVDAYCPKALTSGIKALVDILQMSKVKVFIISGGLKEAILPFARYLNIPDSCVHAVEINWTKDDRFQSLNEQNGFAVSKLAGTRKVQSLFVGKTVIVGDGYTDFEVYKEGFADDFIAYTEHIKRDKVVELALLKATSVNDLKLLFDLLESNE